MATTKDIILQTTIKLVMEKGDVTIRQIAEEAQINVASIKYHYGNKNNLLKEVELYFANNLYNMQKAILDNKKLDPIDKIKCWANELLEYMFKYPSIVTLIVNLVNEENTYNPQLVDQVYMNTEIMEEVFILIGTIIDKKDIGIIKNKYTYIFSAILGLVINDILTTKYNKSSIFTIKNRNQRTEYINQLIEAVLK